MHLAVSVKICGRRDRHIAGVVDPQKSKNELRWVDTKCLPLLTLSVTAPIVKQGSYPHPATAHHP